MNKFGLIEMGVYHLMGLGLSPGTVIGPFSYLAYRYERWNPEDRHFFSRSGEIEQRELGAKVGDIQALVMFTTKEVIEGTKETRSYIENMPGQIKGLEHKGGKMKDVLRKLLRKEWPQISNRHLGEIFWCEVDLKDILLTFDHIAKVVTALGTVGSQGKELWSNLTGGNNVVNFALQLAAALSGEVSRLYYVQAGSSEAEKCLRFTSCEGYWVEMPVMPLSLNEVSLGILEMLEYKTLKLENLYSQMCGHPKFYIIAQDEGSPAAFKEKYLTSMWHQGLIREQEKNVYSIGPQWEIVCPYENILQKARKDKRTIEQLAKEEPWIEMEHLKF